MPSRPCPPTCMVLATISACRARTCSQPCCAFLHVDDLADACLFLMQRYEGEQWINVGWGTDVTIEELARTIARLIGFRGTLRFDTSKPDGTPRKLLNTERLTAL